MLTLYQPQTTRQQRQEIVRLLCAYEVAAARADLTLKSEDSDAFWQASADLEATGWSYNQGIRPFEPTEQEWEQIWQAGRDEKHRIYGLWEAYDRTNKKPR